MRGCRAEGDREQLDDVLGPHRGRILLRGLDEAAAGQEVVPYDPDDERVQRAHAKLRGGSEAHG